MRLLGASTLIIVFVPLLAGEYGVAGLTAGSIFLAWMSGLAIAGVRYLKKNRLVTTLAQIGLFLASLGISSLTGWTFFTVSEVGIKLLHLTVFTFCIAWIFAPRAALAAEAAAANMQNFTVVEPEPPVDDISPNVTDMSAAFEAKQKPENSEKHFAKSISPEKFNNQKSKSDSIAQTSEKQQRIEALLKFHSNARDYLEKSREMGPEYEDFLIDKFGKRGINVDAAFEEVRDQFESSTKPFNDEHKNILYQTLIAQSPSAAAEFLSALTIMGDSVSPDEVFEKLSRENFDHLKYVDLESENAENIQSLEDMGYSFKIDNDEGLIFVTDKDGKTTKNSLKNLSVYIEALKKRNRL